MILVTSLQNETFVINAELIELVEAMPDTIMTLSTGKKIIVQEPIEEILQRVIDYRRKINQGR